MRATCRSALIAALAAALPATFSCREPVFASRDARIVLVSASEWPGAEVVLASPSFFGPDTLPLVLVGDDTLRARFVPPDTVVAYAPERFGRWTIWVQFASGGRIDAGDLEVTGGFNGYWQGPPVGGHVVVWPVRGEPRFVAGGAEHLLLIDPAARTSEQLVSDSLYFPGCVHGPGFDVDGALVLGKRDSTRLPDMPCGRLYAYQEVSGQLVAIDSGPSGWSGAVVRLGDGDWIQDAKYYARRWIRAATGAVETADYQVNQANAYAVSPVGARAVPTNAGVADIPVFVRGTLAPAYRLTGFRWSQGAIFSEDGDTLFYAGWPSDTASARLGYIIAAARAADGSLLRTARNDLWSDNFLLDPNGKWIYSVGSWGPTGPIVQVLDRASLRVVARLQPPPGAIPNPNVFPGYASYFTPILSAADRTLYVAATDLFSYYFAANPVEVCSFKLPD